MAIIIALILSIVLQFFATVVAISLIKKTKYNAAWILVSLGLVLMSVSRLIELIPFLNKQQPTPIVTIAHWLGVVISIIIAIGVFYIRKIFRFLERVEQLKVTTEKRVFRAIIRTEEKERVRFAKEIHDGVGPLLSSIKMSVSGLRNAKDEEKRQRILKNIETVVDEALMSVKEISNSLSPHILNNFGLYSAIKSFTDKINESNSLKIELNSNLQEIRFDFNIETIVYRILCELIHNTIKHASAKRINIDLFLEEKKLKIYYYDDGIGLDINKINSGDTSGMGYSNILTRLKSINGTLNVDSQMGEGVHYTINIELKTNE